MRFLTVPLLAVVLAACQFGPPTTHPVPSVGEIGADLKCPSRDHGYADIQAGWEFCYPGTWKYDLRSQPSTAPPGLDIVFDITDVPCVAPSAAPGQPTPRPICSPNAGLFAVMVISTYERGSASSLSAWLESNQNPVPTFSPISWGNAAEAGKLSDGRRIALTPHHVVILDLRSGTGLLDLETPTSSLLGTWKFTF